MSRPFYDMVRDQWFRITSESLDEQRLSFWDQNASWLKLPRQQDIHVQAWDIDAQCACIIIYKDSQIFRYSQYSLSHIALSQSSNKSADRLRISTILPLNNGFIDSTGEAWGQRIEFWQKGGWEPVFSFGNYFQQLGLLKGVILPRNYSINARIPDHVDQVQQVSWEIEKKQKPSFSADIMPELSGDVRSQLEAFFYRCLDFKEETLSKSEYLALLEFLLGSPGALSSVQKRGSIDAAIRVHEFIQSVFMHLHNVSVYDPTRMSLFLLMQVKKEYEFVAERAYEKEISVEWSDEEKLPSFSNSDAQLFEALQFYQSVLNARDPDLLEKVWAALNDINSADEKLCWVIRWINNGNNDFECAYRWCIQAYFSLVDNSIEVDLDAIVMLANKSSDSLEKCMAKYVLSSSQFLHKWNSNIIISFVEKNSYFIPLLVQQGMLRYLKPEEISILARFDVLQRLGMYLLDHPQVLVTLNRFQLRSLIAVQEDFADCVSKDEDTLRQLSSEQRFQMAQGSEYFAIKLLESGNILSYFGITCVGYLACIHRQFAMLLRNYFALVIALPEWQISAIVSNYSDFAFTLLECLSLLPLLSTWTLDHIFKDCPEFLDRLSHSRDALLAMKPSQLYFYASQKETFADHLLEYPDVISQFSAANLLSLMSLYPHYILKIMNKNTILPFLGREKVMALAENDFRVASWLVINASRLDWLDKSKAVYISELHNIVDSKEEAFSESDGSESESSDEWGGLISYKGRVISAPSTARASTSLNSKEQKKKGSKFEFK